MGDKKDRTTGQIKEKAGEAVGSRKLAASGRRERDKGKVKQGVEKVKNSAKD
jgi:uncharacterized protein YjbJ (UPF0337 family)